MFWTEIGNVVKIERAGMDGSERRAVVNASLGWPGGVAVDAIAERVYWADERLGAIGSATLAGNDIRVKKFGKGGNLFIFLSSLLNLMSFWFFFFSLPQILQTKETSNPFSLAVFNDMLYWTDAKKRVVHSAHKVSGKNGQILLKRQKQPFGVKVNKLLNGDDVITDSLTSYIWRRHDGQLKHRHFIFMEIPEGSHLGFWAII